MYELEDIKKIRKRLGITQAQLSKEAGVSQSLIAKIEGKRIEPNFSSVKRIFEVLSQLSKEDQLVASDIMARRIIDCRKEDSLPEVIEKMRRYNISQLPVFLGVQAIGMVSESAILDRLSASKEGIAHLKVADVIEDCPPIVNEKTPADAISNLLRHFPLVLVATNGRVEGVITKSDMLNAASKAT